MDILRIYIYLSTKDSWCKSRKTGFAEIIEYYENAREKNADDLTKSDNDVKYLTLVSDIETWCKNAKKD